MSANDPQKVALSRLRTAAGRSALADIDVVIAVDESADVEEVLRGKWDWEMAVATAREDDLSVLRVKVDSSQELDELRAIVDDAPGGD
ncbi:MAG TPA: hypothetical protein P5572_07855 [Phycisphaerae bacterium]|nr:hypothetical protein [Phycisphaerales bacterium]HRX84916.1 hypothetical protein [Phycisphaerae bacterium]